MKACTKQLKSTARREREAAYSSVSWSKLANSVGRVSVSAGLFLISLSGRHPDPHTPLSIFTRWCRHTIRGAGNCLQFGEAETVCQLGGEGARQCRRIQDPASKPGNARQPTPLACDAAGGVEEAVGHSQFLQASQSSDFRGDSSNHVGRPGDNDASEDVVEVADLSRDRPSDFFR